MNINTPTGWRRRLLETANLTAFALLLLCLHPAGVDAAENSTAGQRIIVKWKSGTGRSAADALTEAAQRLRTNHRVGIRQNRQLDARRGVLNFERTLSASELQSTLQTLRAQSDVEYAVVDQRRYAHATIPSDPYFGPTTDRTGQWYLQADEPAALNAVGAWDETHGSSGVVVAVLDTGVRFDHPDLLRASAGGKLLDGYDFVSCDQVNCAASGVTYLTANDGNGWDSDPSDPGDWINSTDRQNALFEDCESTNSSWHGTRVAGVIGAATDNGTGIAGAAWNTSVLPVRVIGKCGGYDSDILSALRWAAGLSVTDAPANPNPAHIINLSLGAVGECTAAYQDVIDEMRAQGVVIVASAGNEGGPTDAPANCEGVIGVAGVRHQGDKVGYSSLGEEIAISAPAGNCVNTSANEPCLYSIETTFNTGETSPGANSYTDQYQYNVGTSFSAPLVSGVAALMLAVNPYLTPDLLLSRMQSSATAFPSVMANTCHVPTSANDLQETQCNCTTSTCGAGMVNAFNAVKAAEKPIISISGANTVDAGQSIVLDASASLAADGYALSYTWSIVSGNATLANANQAAATLTAPAVGGAVTVRLTVTDSGGVSDYQDVSVTVNGPATSSSGGGATSESPAASSGGGGGAIVWEWLALMMLASLVRAGARSRFSII